MIWAQASDGAIGRDGQMPWHLPEDLAHFKRTTLGAPVLMGRRTWESLPERFRPLPGRENLVITRDAAYDAPGATVHASLDAAVRSVGQSPVSARSVAGSGSGPATGPTSESSAAPDAWIMGGGELYRAAMPLAAELVVTRIDLEVPDADTFAPEIGPEWRLADPGAPLVAASGLGYRFERWVHLPEDAGQQSQQSPVA